MIHISKRYFKALPFLENSAQFVLVRTSSRIRAAILTQYTSARGTPVVQHVLYLYRTVCAPEQQRHTHTTAVHTPTQCVRAEIRHHEHTQKRTVGFAPYHQPQRRRSITTVSRSGAGGLSFERKRKRVVRRTALCSNSTTIFSNSYTVETTGDNFPPLSLFCCSVVL